VGTNAGVRGRRNPRIKKRRGKEKHKEHFVCARALPPCFKLTAHSPGQLLQCTLSHPPLREMRDTSIKAKENALYEITPDGGRGSWLIQLPKFASPLPHTLANLHR
jgi:hypothetical protein